MSPESTSASTHTLCLINLLKNVRSSERAAYSTDRQPFVKHFFQIILQNRSKLLASSASLNSFPLSEARILRSLRFLSTKYFTLFQFRINFPTSAINGSSSSLFLAHDIDRNTRLCSSTRTPHLYTARHLSAQHLLE